MTSKQTSKYCDKKLLGTNKGRKADVTTFLGA